MRWNAPRVSSEPHGWSGPRLIAMGVLALWTLGANVGTQESGVSGYFDVADFGATPCDTTSDTTYIQQAIDAAAANYAPVWIGAGEWMIDNQIRLKSGTTLHGAGAGITVIKNTDASFHANQLAVLGDSSITIADLTLDGNVTSRMTYTNGLKIQGGSNGRCNDIRVLNVNFNDHQNGIDCGTVSTAENVLIQGCNFVGQSATTARASRAMNMRSAARNWRISYCDATGGLPQPAAEAAIPGGDLFNVDGIGVTISNITLHDFSHGLADTAANLPGGIGMFVSPTSRNVVISSCSFDNVAGDNLSIRGGGVTVSNCSFRYVRDQGIVIEGDPASSASPIELVSVSGCTIDSTRTTGIRVIHAREVSLDGNTIRYPAALAPLGSATQGGARSGIGVFNTAASESILSVSITDNFIIGDTDSTRYGIYIDSGTGVVDSVFVAQNVTVDADTTYGGDGFPGDLIDGSIWSGHDAVVASSVQDSVWTISGGTAKVLAP